MYRTSAHYVGYVRIIALTHTQSLRVDCTKATDELTSQSQRWAQEKRHLTEEAKTLKAQCRTGKSVESNLSAQLMDQRERLQTATLELNQER